MLYGGTCIDVDEIGIEIGEETGGVTGVGGGTTGEAIVNASWNSGTVEAFTQSVMPLFHTNVVDPIVPEWISSKTSSRLSGPIWPKFPT